DAHLGSADTVISQGLDIEANAATQKATATTVVGEGTILGGGGKAVGHATIDGGTSASIGQGSTVTVTDSSGQELATSSPPRYSDVLIATGNLIAGDRHTDAP